MSKCDGEPPSKKPKTGKGLPPCPYGVKCYRKNPQHFKEYEHPPKDGSSKDGDASKATTVSIDTSKLPVCAFGANCYRKNLLHFAEFSHPFKGGGPSTVPDDSGSDTDVMESEDEVEDDKHKGKGKRKSNMNRGPSLLKSYSQMTEDERKDLIKRAFEAKQQLEKELAKTKENLEAKDKELKKLENEVNTGVLLMDGEEEAMNSDEIKYFPMIAERAYKEGSAAQVHFRLAESQFYRLLGGATRLRVTKVEYVVNPKLIKRFREAKENIKKKRGELMSYPVLAFHGTNEKNIIPICETGFKVPGDSGFQHVTDTGWYGKGVYFSEFPEYSMSYIQGSEKLMLCQVLPGKVFKCTKLIHGEALKKGSDSHTSPDGKELVIFNSHHILPCYIVYYTSTTKEFKYQKALSQRKESPDMIKLYNKALKVKETKIFNKIGIQFSGKQSVSKAKAMALVNKHGSRPPPGLKHHYNIFVCGEEEFNIKTAQVKQAISWGISIVREDYIYESIIKKKKLDPDDFAYI